MKRVCSRAVRNAAGTAVILTLVSAVALLVAPVTMVWAQTAQGSQSDVRQFVLHNHTSWDFMYIYASPSNSEYWGSDLLGSDVLMAGDDLRLDVPATLGTCSYDFRVEGFGGEADERFGVDLCKTTSLVFGQPAAQQAPSAASSSGGWAAQAETVCEQAYGQRQVAGPVLSGDIDDEMALAAKYAADVQNRTASSLQALSQPPAAAKTFITNLLTLGTTNTERAGLYADHVIISQRLNTLESVRNSISGATVQMANELGVPACGDVAKLG